MSVRGKELEVIRHIRSAAGRPHGALRLGIGDDCAVLRPPRGHEVLVTTDFSLEGRHFRRDWHSGSSAGHRCLARGLSDLAAMGAAPMSAFLSLALPSGLRKTATGRRWLHEFFEGLLALARATGTPLGGGDTAAAPGNQVLADIVLVGSAPAGEALRRSGAKAGDAIYVTGALGGAAAELEALSNHPRRFRQCGADGNHPHLFPQPRLKAGQALLRRRLATAVIDLSDGLSTDLNHLCEASGVGAVIDADALPLHTVSGSTLTTALHGGEDYELLFTVAPEKALPRSLGGVPITRIGRITRQRDILLRSRGKDRPLKAAGWEHTL